VKTFGLVAAALLICPAALAAPHPQPAAPAPAPTPSGTLSICNVSGTRPITNALIYTLVAPAYAGGTQTLTVAVGACAPQIFYPQGTAVVVNETVPAGYAVTSIAIGNGGSTLSANTPAAGSATVTIGAGQSVLSFVTSGPPRPCKVPAVTGLTLTAAKGAIVKAACGVGRLRRVFSRSVRIGHVMTQYPRRGALLSHGAPVNLVVSRGPS
jgi:hypothetical protein